MPPHNKTAERAVLGAMLRENHVIADVVRILSTESFYLFAHRCIFEAMLDLHERDKPVDAVTVADALNARGHVEDVGGYGYLLELWASAPVCANADDYARIVLHTALCRDLAGAGAAIAEEASVPRGSAEELITAAQQRILELARKCVAGDAVPFKDAVGQAFAVLEARTKQGGEWRSAGLRTGLIDLDDLTAGLQPGELVIVAARPSVGKTAFALNLARNAAGEQAKPVLFSSLEMSIVELCNRILCAQARVNTQRLRFGKLTGTEKEKLIQAGEDLRGMPLWFDFCPGRTMLHIGANARRKRLRDGLAVLFVDYLQLIQPENRRDPPHVQVAAISRQLKQLAQELEIPVVALAQLNRRAEDRERPRLSDLKDSGAIEQDADTVMLLHREQDAERAATGAQGDGPIDVMVEKQRNGATGWMPVMFRRSCGRFENLTP
jgi:replicative DNA helicase